MANAFYFTNAITQAMATAAATAIDAGTAAVLNIYSGTIPANADAALSGNTLLAQLVCSATAVSGYSDTGTATRAALAVIADDTSADATGTATFFRILTQSGGTVCAQGTVGTSGADLNLNTVGVVAGLTVSVTAGYFEIPEGP